MLQIVSCSPRTCIWLLRTKRSAISNKVYIKLYHTNYLTKSFQMNLQFNLVCIQHIITINRMMYIYSKFITGRRRNQTFKSLVSTKAYGNTGCFSDWKMISVAQTMKPTLKQLAALIDLRKLNSCNYSIIHKAIFD